MTRAARAHRVEMLRARREDFVVSQQRVFYFALIASNFFARAWIENWRVAFDFGNKRGGQVRRT